MQSYCYWSFCDGPYAGLMERCVASARRAGIFKEFHVLTDRVISGCECYDAQSIDKTDGFFKFVYLKAGLSKLPFDYLIWVDADTCFVRNPVDVLAAMIKSPLHVPLGTELSLAKAGAQIDGLPASRYAALMKEAGVYNPAYHATSAFWIIQRDAIEHVCDLARDFRAFASKQEVTANASTCFSYAMQMLCADPRRHQASERSDLWGSDDQGHFLDRMPDGQPWMREDLVDGSQQIINPCIIHLPHLKNGAQ